MQVTTNNLLLTGIPKYYGLKQIPLKYALVAYDEDTLVIGSEGGVLICYNYKSSACCRVPPQGYSTITCIILKGKILVWGTGNGHVGIKEILHSDAEPKQVIGKAHSSNVTCVSCHGNRVVSTGRDGDIVVSDVTWAKQGSLTTTTVHVEASRVLSLFSVSSHVILLATFVKTAILNIEGGVCSVIPVGSKERKGGEFGSCALDTYTVLVARPGLRLWYANTSGQVIKTIQLRNLLTECSLACCSENIDKEAKLSSFLPKSGIINRVERIDDKLIIIQCRDVFVFLETIDLSVVGWLKEPVIDWCAGTRSIVLLHQENVIKRFVVSVDNRSSDNVYTIEPNVNTLTVNKSAVDKSNVETQNGVHISKTRDLENGQFHQSNAEHLNQIGSEQIIPKYIPVAPEKLAEISNFVNTVCEREDSKENADVSNQQLVGKSSVKGKESKPNDVLTEPRDIITEPRDVIAEPRDVIAEPRDVITEPRDVVAKPRDVIAEPRDVITEPCDVIAEPRDVITEPRDVIADPRDVIAEPRDVIAEPRDVITEPRDVITEPRDVITEPRDVIAEPRDIIADPRDVITEPRDVIAEQCDGIAEQRDVIAEPRDIITELGDVITSNENSASQTKEVDTLKNDRNSSENNYAESEKPAVDDIPPTTNNVITSRDVTGPSKFSAPHIRVSGETVTENVALNEFPDIATSEHNRQAGSEKSVMEELKENLGKKITAFGLAQNTLKPKQLITSDSTLPPYEPDKISLSSQDTISIHSGSTNCDDDEDKIAVRIKRKKLRPRKEKSSSNEMLDSVAGETILEVVKEPPDLKPLSTTDTETMQETPDRTVILSEKTVEGSGESRALANPEQSSEELELTINDPNLGNDLNTNLDKSLDVGMILSGLANLEEGVLRLDELGLPGLECDDPYSDSELNVSVDMGEQSEQSSEQTSSPTTLDVDLSSNIIANNISNSSYEINKVDWTNEDDEIFDERNARRYVGREEENDVSDIYSPRSFSESTADLYELERRPSVEYGEDPLTGDLDDPPSLLQATPNVSRDRATRVAGSRDDSPFMTDDSWLELRGPTMSRMYVTISCLAVSSASVWCTDNWGNVYYSPNTRGHSLVWQRVGGGKLVSLSVSDSGYIVWGVTTNKRAVVRFGIEPDQLYGTDWSEMMLEAVSVAVDEDGVWMLVSSGKERSLFFREGITRDDPQGEKWLPVSTQSLVLTSLSVNHSVVWGVLDSGKLVIRHGISASQPLGNSWHVLSVNNVKECHVDRHWEVGWVVDTAGIVHFQCGVSPAKPRGSNLWWQVSVCEQLGSNFVTHTVSLFSLRRRTLDVKQVCTSTDGGVWLLSNYNTLHRRYGIITGHNWANISRTYITGRREQWQTLAGEGAYPYILGPVWGLTVSGEIVCFTRSSPPRAIDVPCTQGRVVDVAASLHVLWAVDQSGQVHVRQGLARDNVTGTGWQTLNMAQMSGVLLQKLSCSDRGVWAVDSAGRVWYRTGCIAGTDVVQAWLRVESKSLKFREVSSAGTLVWGVDSKQGVYVRTGVSPSLPVGLDWELVPGLQCVHVRAAQGGVVALSSSQHLVYRYGACPALPAGNYWRRVPGPPPDGSVSLLTTLGSGGVWCQSGRSNLLYRRRVKTVPDAGSLTNPTPDEDWEVV